VLLVLLCALPSVAQDAAALTARLHAAAAASSIDTPDLLPWHLKLDVQLFDAQGKPTDKGTVEEWWASPDMIRVTYTMPSYTVTKLHKKDGSFRTKGPTDEPAILDDLLAKVAHPMPTDAEVDRANPDLRKQKFGNVELDCIMLDQLSKDGAPPPLGRFPTFCLDPGKDSLRIITEPGSRHFARNHVGIFQGRAVAVDIAGDLGGTEVVSGHVSALSIMKPTDADFVPGADMEPGTAIRTVRISAGTVAGQIISRTQPIYPLRALTNHVSGTVILHAIIGRDGRIQNLQVLSSPDMDLLNAAMAAVWKWTYKPYMLNGEPVAVETTINVNFAPTISPAPRP
jgi:TonB family protein